MDVELGEIPKITVARKTKKDWMWDFRALDNSNGIENIMDDGDTVLSLTITPPTGVTVTAGPNIVNNGTSVQVKFEFSGATVGDTLRVEADLITNDDWRDEFPIEFVIDDR